MGIWGQIQSVTLYAILFIYSPLAHAGFIPCPTAVIESVLSEKDPTETAESFLNEREAMVVGEIRTLAILFNEEGEKDSPLFSELAAVLKALAEADITVAAERHSTKKAKPFARAARERAIDNLREALLAHADQIRGFVSAEVADDFESAIPNRFRKAEGDRTDLVFLHFRSAEMADFFVQASSDPEHCIKYSQRFSWSRYAPKVLTVLRKLKTVKDQNDLARTFSKWGRYDRLAGDHAGRYRIDVDLQYRITFLLFRGSPQDIVVEDYHGPKG